MDSNDLGSSSDPFSNWNVLVVDDEEDVHAVTVLALKRREWHGRPFTVVSASSAEQAKQILADNPQSTFQVALVDVVMETETAGLELCDFIRSRLPRSLRIILRTGQPGVAPEERVMDEFEIDHYLPKVEATAERIYSLVRASLRSSLDMSVMLSLTSQLNEFAKAVETGMTADQLDPILTKALDYLEWKNQAEITFYPALERKDDSGAATGEDAAKAETLARDSKALIKAHDSSLQLGVFHKGSIVGLPSETMFWIDSIADFLPRDYGLVSMVKRVFGGDDKRPPLRFGYVIELPKQMLASAKLREGFARELALFTENWKTTRRVVDSQQDIAKLRAAHHAARVGESSS